MAETEKEEQMKLLREISKEDSSVNIKLNNYISTEEFKRNMQFYGSLQHSFNIEYDLKVQRKATVAFY